MAGALGTASTRPHARSTHARSAHPGPAAAWHPGPRAAGPHLLHDLELLALLRVEEVDQALVQRLVEAPQPLAGSVQRDRALAHGLCVVRRAVEGLAQIRVEALLFLDERT